MIPRGGHIKEDGHLERNHITGPEGDAINAVLCAASHNMRHMRLLARWLRLLLALILTAILWPERSSQKVQPPVAA